MIGGIASQRGVARNLAGGVLCGALVTACSTVPIRPTPTPRTTPPSSSELHASLEPAFNRLAELEAYGQSVPDVFGGVYLDDGAPVLLVTDDLARHRAELAHREIDLAGVRLVWVQHTEEELVTIQQRIAGDQFAGVQLVSVLVDLRGNRVDVTVRSDLPDARPLLLDRWHVDDSVVRIEVEPLIRQ